MKKMGKNEKRKKGKKKERKNESEKVSVRVWGNTCTKLNMADVILVV